MSKHFVKIPTVYKSLKDNVGIALMNGAFGNFDIDADELTSSRHTVLFNLSTDAERFLNELLDDGHVKRTKRQIFCVALHWLSQQPAHVQSSRL